MRSIFSPANIADDALSAMEDDADAGQRSLAALLERCLEAHRREEAARAAREVAGMACERLVRRAPALAEPSGP